MKTFSRLLLTSAALGLALGTASADNFIYKGTGTVQELVSGIANLGSAYFILGPETARNDGFDTTATLIAFGTVKGKKVMQKTDFGTLRGLRSAVDKGMKEVLCKGAASFTASTSHHTDSTYLIGMIKGTKYPSPLQLTGLGISVDGNNDFTSPFSSLTRSKYSFTLNEPLTNASITAADTQAEAVQRIVNLLENKGYTEL